jgi:hypothetical protein
VRDVRGAHVVAALDAEPEQPGIWAVEARLEDESLGRWTFRVVPPSG